MGIKAVENRVNTMKTELDTLLAEVRQGKYKEARHRTERMDTLSDDLNKAIWKMQRGK